MEENGKPLFIIKRSERNKSNLLFPNGVPVKSGSAPVIILVFVLILLGAFSGLRYLGFFAEKNEEGALSEKTSKKESVLSQPKEKVGTTIEKVAEGLEVPWSLVFTSNERMLVTERPGRIRVIEKEVLLKQPLYTFDEVVSTSEEGLMGLALDPHYEDNKYLYTSLAYEKAGRLVVKVVRLRDEGDTLSEPLVIIDDIPAANFHAGSRLKFGPDDGKLYITTGDATDKNIAQNLKNLGGKILRINSDGSIPEDNPFPGNPVFSYGHRNPQGIAWQPETGVLYETEHGPSVFDGPAGGDEINRIEKGKNYGWPLVSHNRTKSGTETPLLVFTPAVAPSGATFYGSSVIPQFTGKFFFALLKGEGIMEVTFDDKGISKNEKMEGMDFGRIRDVVEGPDGALYFLTSNRDGRGNPKEGDDKILRIRAKTE